MRCDDDSDFSGRKTESTGHPSALSGCSSSCKASAQAALSYLLQHADEQHPVTATLQCYPVCRLVQLKQTNHAWLAYHTAARCGHREAVKFLIASLRDRCRLLPGGDRMYPHGCHVLYQLRNVYYMRSGGDTILKVGCPLTSFILLIPQCSFLWHRSCACISFQCCASSHASKAK